MVPLTTVFKWSYVVKIYAGLVTGICNLIILFYTLPYPL